MGDGRPNTRSTASQARTPVRVKPEPEQVFAFGPDLCYLRPRTPVRALARSVERGSDGQPATHRPPAPGPRVHRGVHARAGYPPSVREIGEAVGLTSPSTRARPPRHAAAARLPAPRPHQAARHRGALRPEVGRRGRAPPGAPRARSSATSPPAPTCWPRRTSRRSCPVPGRLHRRRRALHAPGARRLDDRRRHPRRRLRGGPLRSPTADEGRHRRRRHPRRGGHGQDLPAHGAPRSCCCRPTPARRRWCSTPPRSRSTAGSSPCSAASSPRPGPPAPGAFRSLPPRRAAPRPERPTGYSLASASS